MAVMTSFCRVGVSMEATIAARHASCAEVQAAPTSLLCHTVSINTCDPTQPGMDCEDTESIYGCCLPSANDVAYGCAGRHPRVKNVECSTFVETHSFVCSSDGAYETDMIFYDSVSCTISTSVAMLREFCDGGYTIPSAERNTTHTWRPCCTVVPLGFSTYSRHLSTADSFAAHRMRPFGPACVDTEPAMLRQFVAYAHGIK